MIYLELFLEFFKIGLFTFGGGYAMIPLVRETVLNHGWLGEEMFYDFIGVCESTPGPIAINMATYIGSVQGGVLGSICATLGVVLPSFIIILLIATILSKIIKNRFVQRFLNGIKPVVIALISSVGILLLMKSIGYNQLNEFVFNYKALIIFSIVAIIYLVIKKVFKKKLGAIFIILISAALGLIIMII